MNRFKKVLAVLFSLLMVFSLPAQTKTVKAGFPIPKDKNLGNYYGYEYEYFQELSKFTGWKLEFIDGTKDEYIQWLKQGKIDVILDYPYLEDYEHFTKCDSPFMQTDCYIFKHKNNETIQIDSDYFTEEARIGVVKGSSSEIALEDYQNKTGIKFNIVYYSDIRNLMTNFYSSASSIDFICLSDFFAKNYEDLVSVIKIASNDLYVIFNKNNTSIIRDFNRAQYILNERNPYFMRRLKERTYEFRNPPEINYKPEREWLASHNKLVVGYIKDNYLFCNTKSDGTVQGFLPRYMEELLKRIGLNKFDVNYVRCDSYEEGINALKNHKVDLLFPFYGEYYETDKYDLQKTDSILNASLELVYKKSTTRENIKKIYTSSSFEFIRVYAEQYLSEYEIIDTMASPYEAAGYLLNDDSAIIVSKATIEILLATSMYRNIAREALKDKCPICFSVRRDDIGLLNLMDRGINLLEPSFADNVLIEMTFADRKYTALDFIEDNFVIVAFTIFAVFLLILLIVGLYIKTIQSNKEKIEIAKHEVEQALQVAKVASQAKSNFLNNMSHDIRTPMNAIMGFTNIAQKALEKGEDVSAYLSKIKVSSKHLLDLINDVLDMSRIESGKVILAEATYNIISLTEEMKTIIQTDIASKNINFTVDVSQVQNEYIRCDKLRLNQIFLNLLSNAVKFTPEGGQIDFIITESDSNIVDKRKFKIVVQDNGIGMSEDFKKVLFAPFEREKSSTISKIQGTGLGMAITKNLVDMMRGTIQVDSTKNEGTTISVEFDFTIVDESEIDNEATVAKIEKVNVNNFMNKRVLLVEDNILNQEITTSILNQFGFVVETADNGQIAIEKIKAVYKDKAKRYDVVLMDIQMPVMDGYEATRQIRAIEDAYIKQLPILAMTANAFEEDKKAAFAAGMNAHIPKPIDANELVKTIWMSLE